MGEVARAQVISANGATDTIFINYSAPNVRFKFNNNGFYTDITWPCTIVNNNPGGPALKVLFENNVTLSSASSYFICGSANIQFGSTALKSDGTRPKITVASVTDYPGLVQNGAAGQNGYSNVSILNLEVLADGSTLTSPPFDAGGWIGQAYFGKGASGCYVVSCSSNGDMGSSSGGIVGENAGSENSGKLTIVGCFSSGSIDSDAGGIAGSYAGYNGGEVIVRESWSSGGITGLQGGGIFGSTPAYNGKAIAENCFSAGVISAGNGGGIFGKFAGAGVGSAIATNCYSRGTITAGDAGGIFGGNGAFASGTAIANNCYSAGTVATAGNGIYGSNKESGAMEANCYVANSAWSSVTANANLTGVPLGNSVIGTTWADTALNQPYDFSKFGYTPYSTNNISITGGVPSLVQSHNQTVTAGSSSSAAIVSGLNYTILQKSRAGVVGAYPTITIKSTTGVISTTARTAAGTYTLTIDNEVPGDSDGYAITEVVLTVKAKPQNNRVRPKRSW